MKKILAFLLRISIGVTLGIPTLLYPLLYFRQEAMLFHPRPLSTEQAAWIDKHYPNTRISIQTDNDITLRGWLRKSPEPGPLLLYFGGNAEEVSHLLDIELPPNWSLLLMNYRGYGESDGKPGEAALFKDALAIYDAVHADFSSIAVMGRSLGTGVAVYVASQRPVCGAVLTSPYDSIRQLAQDMYPYVPVGWLLRHHFDAEAYAVDAKAPMLAMIADADQIIPPIHSKRLLQVWGGKASAHHFPDADHNSITGQPGFWSRINQFLNEADECSVLESAHG